MKVFQYCLWHMDTTWIPHGYHMAVQVPFFNPQVYRQQSSYLTSTGSLLSIIYIYIHGSHRVSVINSLLSSVVHTQSSAVVEFSPQTSAALGSTPPYKMGSKQLSGQKGEEEGSWPPQLIRPWPRICEDLTLYISTAIFQFASDESHVWYQGVNLHISTAIFQFAHESHM